MIPSNSDRVLSLSKSAKSPLTKVSYDPILYGDDFAGDLNRLDHNEPKPNGGSCEDDAITEDKLGSRGDFISITKSFPFEMLLETMVCGPVYRRKSKQQEEGMFVFENDSYKETTDCLEKNNQTRDKIIFMTKMLENPENYVPLNSGKNASSSRIWESIGSISNISDSTSFAIVNDDTYAHLSVREQLSGRLETIKDIQSNKNNSTIEKRSSIIDSNKFPSSVSNPITKMQRDQTLRHFQPHFLKICSKPTKSCVFTRRLLKRNQRRSLLKAIIREIRKRLHKIKEKINASSNFDEELELTFILFEAISIGDVNIVRMLLAKGAIVDFVSPYSYGRTAFQTVFVRICRIDAGLELNSNLLQFEEIMDILFCHGCDINKLEDEELTNGWAPIHYASMCGKLKRVEWLLCHGANLDCKIRTLESPLMLACQCGRFEIAYFLVKNNANFRESDCNNNTVLHHVSMSGNKALLEFLVECGAIHDKLKKNLHGETPILICNNVCQECSEYLQKATLKRQQMGQYIDKLKKNGK